MSVLQRGIEGPSRGLAGLQNTIFGFRRELDGVTFRVFPKGDHSALDKVLCNSKVTGWMTESRLGGKLEKGVWGLVLGVWCSAGVTSAPNLMRKLAGQRWAWGCSGSALIKPCWVVQTGGLAFVRGWARVRVSWRQRVEQRTVVYASQVRLVGWLL